MCRESEIGLGSIVMSVCAVVSAGRGRGAVCGKGTAWRDRGAVCGVGTVCARRGRGATSAARRTVLRGRGAVSAWGDTVSARSDTVGAARARGAV